MVYCRYADHSESGFKIDFIEDVVFLEKVFVNFIIFNLLVPELYLVL